MRYLLRLPHFPPAGRPGRRESSMRHVSGTRDACFPEVNAPQDGVTSGLLASETVGRVTTRSQLGHEWYQPDHGTSDPQLGSAGQLSSTSTKAAGSNGARSSGPSPSPTSLTGTPS